MSIMLVICRMIRITMPLGRLSYDTFFSVVIVFFTSIISDGSYCSNTECNGYGRIGDNTLACIIWGLLLSTNRCARVSVFSGFLYYFLLGKLASSSIGFE